MFWVMFSFFPIPSHYHSVWIIHINGHINVKTAFKTCCKIKTIFSSSSIAHIFSRFTMGLTENLDYYTSEHFIILLEWQYSWLPCRTLNLSWWMTIKHCIVMFISPQIHAYKNNILLIMKRFVLFIRQQYVIYFRFIDILRITNNQNFIHLF